MCEGGLPYAKDTSLILSGCPVRHPFLFQAWALQSLEHHPPLSEAASFCLSASQSPLCGGTAEVPCSRSWAHHLCPPAFILVFHTVRWAWDEADTAVLVPSVFSSSELVDIVLFLPVPFWRDRCLEEDAGLDSPLAARLYLVLVFL